LLKTEGVEIEFTRDGIEALADIAFEVNRTAQNIVPAAAHDPGEGGGGAELRGSGPGREAGADRWPVRPRQARPIMQREDLSKFIL